MKNQREIYAALLAGEILRDEGNNLTIMLDDNGKAVSNSSTMQPNFYYPENWQIYKETKWHENIPDGGVLCWVSDIPNDSDATIRSVTGYCDDSTHFFETLEESWVHAKPLEKQEIQIYLDNAPEEI